MKKILNLLLSAGLLLSLQGQAQTANTCAASQTLLASNEGINTIAYSNTIWLENTTSSAAVLKIPYKTNSIILTAFAEYTGTCSNLLETRTSNIVQPVGGLVEQYNDYIIYLNAASKIKLTFVGGVAGQTIPVFYGIYKTSASQAAVPCNYFLNGDFEGGDSPGYTVPCKESVTTEIPDWKNYAGTPDLYSTDCITPTKLQIPFTVFNAGTPNTTWNNAATNKHVIGIYGVERPITAPHTGLYTYEEAMKAKLYTPISNGTYTLSFYARMADKPFNYNNTTQHAGRILVRGSTSILFPDTVPLSGTGLINSVYNAGTPGLVNFCPVITVPGPAATTNNGWHFCTQTFNYSGPTLRHLTFGFDGQLTGDTLSPYMLLDDIKLVKNETIIRNDVGPFPTLCINSNPLDTLLNYATVNGLPANTFLGTHVFSGTGVVANTNGTYSFNPAISGAGVFNITYTFTDCLGNVFVDSAKIGVNGINCCTPITYPFINEVANLTTIVGGSPAVINNATFDIPDYAILTINYNVTFNNCKFRMGRESAIKLNMTTANKTTNFKKCQFFNCGTHMWENIDILSSNTAVFDSCTIEDGRRAIYAKPGAILTVKNSLFNKDYIGVYVESAPPPPNGPEVTVAVAMGIVLTNNQFTSAPSGNSPAVLLKFVKPLGAVAFISPIRSYAGVYGSLQNTGNILRIGETNSPTAGNLFRDLLHGIYLDRSTAEIFNNKFYIGGNSIPTQYNSKAIYAKTNVGTTLNYNYMLKVGGTAANNRNQFYTCYYGVYTEQGYDEVDITNNQFIGTAAHNGADAIVLNMDKIRKIKITNNSLNDYIRFCTHFVPTLPAAAGSGASIFINNNIINTVSEGITIQQLGATNINAFTYNVSANTMTNVSMSGIRAVNMSKCMKIESNTITLVLNNTPSFGATGISAVLANDAILASNTINSTAANIAAVTNAELYGIGINQSANTQVKCNTMTNLGTCLAFQGSCLTSATAIDGNFMESGVYGLRLMFAGRIGTQGSLTTKSDNKWGAASTNFPGATKFQTYVQNTTNVGVLATGSVLYMKTLDMPTDNGFLTALNVFPYSTTGANPSLRVSNNTVVGQPICGSGGSTSASRIADVGTPIANNTATYNTYIPESKIQAKSQLYQLIEEEPTAKNNTTINAFYNTEKNATVGKLKQVADEIAANNYTAAQSLNASIITTNTFDESEKLYNDLYLQYNSNPNCCNQIYLNDLELLANRCPIKRGASVYKARALYDYITQTKNTFADNCNSNVNGKILSKFPYDGYETIESEERNNETNNYFQFVPNPNNGQFYIHFDKAMESTIFIKAIDMKGNIVYDKNYEVNGDYLVIENIDLSNGIYVLVIKDNYGLELKQRLVIINNE